MKKIHNNILFKLLCFIFLAIGGLLFSIKVNAAPVVTITSPKSAEKVTKGNVILTGTATPNSSVEVSLDSVFKSIVFVNGTGKWATTLKITASGQHSITAKAIGKDKFYFAGSDFATTNTINTIDQSTKTLNTASGWPIDTSPNTGFLMLPSPSGNFGYTTSVIGGNYVAKVSLTSPATPQLVPSYPASSKPVSMEYTADSSKVFVTNNLLNTITEINTSTNTITGTLDLSSTGLVAPQIVKRLSNGNMYVIGNNNKLVVFNPTTLSLVKTLSECSSMTGINQSVTSNKYYYLGCDSPTLQIQKFDLATDNKVSSISIAHDSNGFVINPDGVTVAAPSQASAAIDFYKLTDSTYHRSVSIPDTAFSGSFSSDGQEYWATTPGLGFSGQNISVVSLKDFSVINKSIPVISIGIVQGPPQVTQIIRAFQVTAAKSSVNSLADTGANQKMTLILASLLITASVVLVTAKRRLYY